jgi:hypothetical protein
MWTSKMWLSHAEKTKFIIQEGESIGIKGEVFGKESQGLTRPGPSIARDGDCCKGQSMRRSVRS